MSSLWTKGVTKRWLYEICIQYRLQSAWWTRDTYMTSYNISEVEENITNRTYQQVYFKCSNGFIPYNIIKALHCKT